MRPSSAASPAIGANSDFSSTRCPVPTSHTNNRLSHRLCDASNAPSLLKINRWGTPRCGSSSVFVTDLTFQSTISVSDHTARYLALGVPGNSLVNLRTHRQLSHNPAGVQIDNLNRFRPADSNSVGIRVKCKTRFRVTLADLPQLRSVEHVHQQHARSGITVGGLLAVRAKGEAAAPATSHARGGSASSMCQTLRCIRTDDRYECASGDKTGSKYDVIAHGTTIVLRSESPNTAI